MAGFLYFVENHPTNVPVVERDVESWGLTHAFNGVPFNSHIYAKTPADRPGVLLADQKRLGPYQPRFLPDQQVWTVVPGGKYWIGYYREAPPTPVDLARSPMVDGYLVEMADGFRWQVPLIRKWINAEVHTTCLPRYRMMAYCDRGQGKWIDGNVVDRYLSVVEIVEDFFASWRQCLVDAVTSKEETFSVALETPERDASAILSVNYAVGEVEMNALRAFANDDHWAASEILKCAADCDAALDWLTYSGEVASKDA